MQGIESVSAAEEIENKALSSESPPHISSCPICLDNIFSSVPETEDFAMQVCSGEVSGGLQHPDFHRGCLKEHINNVLSSSFIGSNPRIYCPVIHSNGRKCLIKFNEWSKITEASQVEKYKSIHEAQLKFLCGSCHTSRSQQIVYKPELILDKDPIFREFLVDEAGFFELFKDYLSGAVDVSHFYKTLLGTNFPQLHTMEDSSVWKVIKLILESIPDPERRSSLQVRHWINRPRFFTSCCNHEHCFNCKTKGFHTGKTCSDNINAFDSSILPCPNCKITLAKSDGCNTITCICGNRFSWSDELEKYKLQTEFINVYLQNPIGACADILCGIIKIVDRKAAEAYRSKNDSEVDRQILKVWKILFPFCGSAAVLKLAADSSLKDRIGIHDVAISVIKRKNDKEISKIQTDVVKAKCSVLNSYYNSDSDKLLAIEIMQQYKADSNYEKRSELLDWKAKNLLLHREFTEDQNYTAIDQFMFLNGNNKLSNIVRVVSGGNYFLSPSWTEAESDPNEKFKFRLCSGSEDMFQIVFDKFTKGNNFNFGLVKAHYEFSGNTIGKSPESFGLVIEQENRYFKPKLYAGSSSAVSEWNQIKEGDVLTCHFNATSNFCEISLNYSESVRFELPSNTSSSQYAFAVSLGNDPNVKISVFKNKYEISNQPSSSTSATSSAGSPHRDIIPLFNMFQYKLQFRTMLLLKNLLRCKPDLESCSKSLRRTVDKYNSLWLSKYADKHEIPVNFRELITTLLSQTSHLVFDYSWEFTFCALSKLIMLDYEKEMAIYADLALQFVKLHGSGSAPFMAVYLLAEKNASSEMDKRIALAYMRTYPKETQDWYDYNDTGPGLFNNFLRGNKCRCLPRHMSSGDSVCPYI